MRTFFFFSLENPLKLLKIIELRRCLMMQHLILILTAMTFASSLQTF